mgnify:CR=1 FL=1
MNIEPQNIHSPKLLVVGSARHGKDTFAEILSQEFDMTFESSSQAASDIFLYESLRGKYSYNTPQECFEDRSDHRKEWYDLICEFNVNDKAALAKDIPNPSYSLVDI